MILNKNKNLPATISFYFLWFLFFSLVIAIFSFSLKSFSDASVGLFSIQRVEQNRKEQKKRKRVRKSSQQRFFSTTQPPDSSVRVFCFVLLLFAVLSSSLSFSVQCLCEFVCVFRVCGVDSFFLFGFTSVVDGFFGIFCLFCFSNLKPYQALSFFLSLFSLSSILVPISIPSHLLFISS